jgi:SAM-dependent methyltransferase
MFFFSASLRPCASKKVVLMSEQIYDMTQGWNSLAAEVLYAFMPDGAPTEELAFYERRIRANGGLALDQACGTGRHIFPLLARGLEVHGADISADALKLAEKEAAVRNIPITLYHQAMEACDIPHRYGTIYVANCTFQIITDRQSALATLQRFWQHLVPGGQLLLELSAFQGFTGHDAEHPMRWDAVPLRNMPGEVVTTLWSESVDIFEQVMVSKRRHDLSVDGTCVRSEVHAHAMRWYGQYEFFMMLERAGFYDIRTYGDYTDDPATQTSKAVVYGARRR